MTILESILAYLAGEDDSIPATNTEAERLLAKAAQKIKAGLLPTPAAPVSPAASADADKVPTVKNDGTYELAAIPSELPEQTASDAGRYLMANGDGTSQWIPSEPSEPTT